MSLHNISGTGLVMGLVWPVGILAWAAVENRNALWRWLRR